MATKQDSQTFLGLKDSAETKVIDMLIPILADSIFIQNLYKKYHWHVEGEDFYQYHLLFDKHAEEHIPIIDTVAERIRTLGGKAPGMPQDVVANKAVSEPSDPGVDGQKMIQNLCQVHEKIIKNLREVADKSDDLGDTGTNDMVVSEVLRVHELQLWFIRSSMRG